MYSAIEYVNVIISMKGCEIDPCDSYIDNPLLSGNVLYDGGYHPALKPDSGSAAVSQTFV